MSKNIVIIGASSGYGRGIASVLSKVEGYDVLTGSRTHPLLDISHMHVDVSDEKSIFDFQLNAIKHFRKIDAVIYSAGIAIDKQPLEKGNTANWDRVFQVNTLGMMQMAAGFIPALKQSKGHFIYIGSIASFTHYVGGSDYCASKAASTSILRTLRYELLGTGIRTVSIEPGLGDTNFQRNRYNGDMEKAKSHYGNIKQLQPEDIGNIVQYILSLPPHVNVDEIVIKPIGQANHGVLSNN